MSNDTRDVFQKRSQLFAGIASAIAMLTLGACTSYTPLWYEGDGTLTTMPPMANAKWRHELELPSISLLSPEVYQFRLAGLPSEDLAAVLSLDQPGDAALDAIEKANTRVRMTLINERTGESSMKEGRLLGDFGSTPESWAGEPMDFEGVWFKPQRHDSFVLKIEVMVAAAPTGGGTLVTATPRVRGGAGLGVKNMR